ncbi:MAG: 2Fe-2S iron-sulfur cluster binding domain-containing protein [Epsilonproteobacteria bacterium]|nr:2Fe-2S iron-sulfur cluster binding domain-containing protein [Campylobacterota bacterium]
MGGAMMRKEVTINIDGKEIVTTNDKTILEVARENGIYIPTMCYLTKVEPIASCRMCVVEVEGVDGFILSCQERVVDGAKIKTNSKALFKERQNIMRLYDVNHPLECGVCDKSGECELQNKTLEFGVDTQLFSAKDQLRKVENWGFISYDPSLCIMCERCVRVCNEIVGDGALEIEVGGYKSRIVKKKDLDNCSQCGECMAVCPVGALVATHFKYTSNAWELEYIPSSCAHCSAGCQLYYNVKHTSIYNPEPKIYRVTNEYEFSNLCGGGRFGFDFENRDAKKDEEALNSAVEAFKRADVIRFSSMITNEEALLLQKIANKYNKRLVCDEAKGFSQFLESYGEVSQKSLWSGDLDTIKKSDFIIVFGSRVYDDAPMVKFALASASRHEKAQVIYLHPIYDERMKPIVTQFIKYEPGSEEGVAALLVDALVDKDKISSSLKEFLNDLDIGYISAESSVSEEEIDELKAKMWKKKRFTFIVGADLYNHPKRREIAKLIAAIEKYTNFDLVIIPPASNSLGVSLICDLDEIKEGDYVVGYNAPGDFTLSALGDGNLDMPAMNQQEGTITTLTKRVVPLHVALPYGGYELNDIANRLGIYREYIVDYTKELPQDKGFSEVEFDKLPDEFSIDGKENRGYLLKNIEKELNENYSEIDELPSFDGTIVYDCNEVSQFNPFTNKSSLLHQEEPILKGSEQFAQAAKIADGDRVIFTKDGIRYERVFKIDTSLKGTIAINPTFDKGLSSFALSSYRFAQVKIEKIGSDNE